MGLRRIVDDLAGRSHQRPLALVDAQLAAALDGVQLASRMSAGDLAPSQARGQMIEVEHAGDRHRAGLVIELSSALTTPFDREDLYRLSRSVDDVLDNLRDLVRETDLYEVEPDGRDLPALAAVAEGLELLREAVAHVLDDRASAAAATFAARKRAGRVRQLYQGAVADLFRTELSTGVLKRRELLRRLDVVGLRLGECADALSDAMQKRSH